MLAQQGSEHQELVNPQEEHTQPRKVRKWRYHEQTWKVANTKRDKWCHTTDCDTDPVGGECFGDEFLGFLSLGECTVKPVHEHLHVVISNANQQESDQLVHVIQRLPTY